MKYYFYILLPLTLHAEPWRESSAISIPAGQTLRGYGRVSVTSASYAGADDTAAISVTFSCQNADKASTLAGKFLADLTLSDGVSEASIKTEGRSIPCVATPSGALAVSLQGASVRIIASASREHLQRFLSAHPRIADGAITSAAYPRYLDRFDRYGWGCYGMGGFNNYHDWMTRVDGKRTFKDPTEDVRFMIEHDFRFEPWLDPVGFDTSDGLQKNSEHEWMIKMLTDAGKPFSFRVYGAAGGADWTARRFPEYIEQPAPFLMSGWHGAQLHHKAQPHLTWFDEDIHRYMAVKTMDMMKPYAGHPLNMGWMHPHGELSHDEWYDRHDDYSPTAHRNWQAYLQAQGLSLADVSRMFGRADQPFAAWDQVPVPEFATFAGLNGRILSLAGTWWWRRGRGSSKKEDDRFPGLEQAWHTQPIDANWKATTLPGGDHLFDVLPKNLGWFAVTWFRRTFTLTHSETRNPKAPIYLYWFPINHGRVHTGEHGRFHGVFINGQKAGGIGTWGALDVTRLLKPGDNEIAVQLFGHVWNGRIFLSTEPPAAYPYLGGDRNRLFLLWQDWHIEAKYKGWVDILDGMRQVAPDRSIKYMAPIKFRADRWLKLARDWGGFGHFTGEGVWYFPWYKRYGFLYDVPGSSEPGSPYGSLDTMFNGFRRTFLAGLNGHDPVFLAQTYTRPQEMRQWWIDHKPVLRRMGKYDIDPTTAPQVLLYRSTHGTIRLYSPAPYPEVGESARKIQNGWDWDLGRGTLQTLGHSYLYLDDGGLADGKMVGYPLMIDCGNEVMPEASVEALVEWVRAGGTYVTLPFSGRSSVLEPDTWPISRLTGCKVAKLRKPGRGKITIKPDQTILKAMAGRAFPDAGVSMNYIGTNENKLSTELQPDEDCEVLATFENGAPAMVRRKLGAGQVIAMGTAFWRQCEDRMGIWWPESLETEFMADLLDGLGFGRPVCTTDDRLVWSQPYRSNNGLNAVTCLVSWHDDRDVSVALKLRIPRKPTRLTSYGVDGIRQLDFDWQDGVATATVPMPAKEVKVITAAVHDPRSAIMHWWNYQQKMWHELSKPSVDFEPYRRGKWRDPTLDLRKGGAELSLAAPGPGAKWQPCPVSILNMFGAQPNKPVWLRKRSDVPEEWQAQGGRIHLVSGAWAGPHYHGSARLSLNGTMLHDFPGRNYQEFDVTRLLTEGQNELLIEFKGDKKYQGLTGNVYLYHARPPARRLRLTGRWDAEDAKGAPVVVTFPGEAKAWSPARTVFIPEEWKSRYHIRLHTEGGPHDTAGALINGRLARKHHHWFGPRCDIDITRHLRFGAKNRLELWHAYGHGARNPKRPPHWKLRKVELHLHQIDRDKDAP
jgi:hypothetical protein